MEPFLVHCSDAVAGADPEFAVDLLEMLDIVERRDVFNAHGGKITFKASVIDLRAFGADIKVPGMLRIRVDGGDLLYPEIISLSIQLDNLVFH